MKQGPLTQAENRIADETKKYNVALEGADDYAKAVGVIISLYAIVEGYPPLLMELLCSMSKGDAYAILGTFRAPSNRLELLQQLARLRPQASEARTIFGYYIGLVTEATKIRNKYAHATYGYAKTLFSCPRLFR